MLKQDARTLTVLTLMYFAIELLVNFSVYKQLSVTNDVFTAESMELWGKIISGLGLGLLLTRYLFSHPKVRYNINVWLQKRHQILWDHNSPYRAFLLVCMVTIPLSFFLQSTLISYVVSHSSVEGRNKALIISATHSALVPFYTTEHWGVNKEIEINSKDHLLIPILPSVSEAHESYKIGGKHFVELSQPSAQQAEQQLGVYSGVDKAFFPYISLINNIDENLFKEIIKSKQLALYDDKTYFRHQTKGGLDQSEIIYELYDDTYQPAVREYNSYKNYSRNLKQAKRAADKQWRERMDSSFGFSTTLKPDANRADFSNHEDVKRIYAEKTGLGDLYPTNDDFRQRILDMLGKELPYAIIPAYIDIAGEASRQSKLLSDDEIERQGKKAYKAIVMPIIALGLSAFFLILNIILTVDIYLKQRFLIPLWLSFHAKFIKKRWWPFVANLINRNWVLGLIRKIGTRPERNRIKLNNGLSYLVYYPARFLIVNSLLTVLLLWFVAAPFLQNSGVYDELENSGYKNTIKWIYYHESNLITAYDNIGVSLSYIGNFTKADADNESLTEITEEELVETKENS